METILEVKNLRKTFYKGSQPLVAVDDVSFSLKKGQKLGIVGESGSGKSTVIQLITRLLEVEEGKIIFKSQDITSLKGKDLFFFYKEMQLIFQDPYASFNPRKKLGISVIESTINQGISKKQALVQAKKLFALCQLPEEFLIRYPHQVSGGQLQRAAIARALMIKPSIIICDEATSSLDVTTQKQILDLLENICQTHNIAYLFISHDLAVVQQFCDYVLVMEHGKVIEQGTPDEIINHPKTETTKEWLEVIF